MLEGVIFFSFCFCCLFSNLLLPEGMTLERQRANFVFKIYRGEDFLKQLKCCNKVEPNVCIEVLFVGLKVNQLKFLN